MTATTLHTHWRHVPVRLDAGRWATRQVRRKLLVVVHTVTAGQRLLDAVRLLEGDPRIQTVFTAAPDVFSNGVGDFLSRLKALVLPWEQAVETEFDLALAAAHGGLHEVHAPVLVLPHGAGHNKTVRHPSATVPPRASGPASRAPSGTPPAGERNVYGLGRQWLVRDGAVVPEAVLLAHHDELARLGRECPEALHVAQVVGDPCYDRIAASLPSRALYRQALGAGHGQKVVLACSTWGPQSLLGREWPLLERLVTELPPGEYRTAALLHPNVWNAHGEWQIGSWLAGLGRRGLSVVSQHSDWCGALAAADVVVGDHGSLSLYGTMTGAPVLLTDVPDTGLDPASPLAELSSFAPRLRADKPLCRQLARAMATYRKAGYERVAQRISSEPGRFAVKMRSLLYRKLRLRATAARLAPRPARLPVTLRFDEPGQVTP
ncbi:MULTISPECIES: hypothetical protein [Streptomyces]|uniref:Uncharacterized protein n=1 Tax=Streptomyces albus TaxID=1888 RepID=A0A8H1QVP2_9ACTN|nr:MULTISPECIES: hypothetical protein [Streptomyces]MDI6410648.1 hypothetical protein [Streptomyces albus]TGG84598.1 hypothetical protein D8771_12075 [Streptomyces albus]UVN56359.1 hypothetical protein NR995_18920 [Streptomyces albus]GHJ22498.1 hypothetical protein TPA0909_41120 [Streptomyces albus]